MKTACALVVVLAACAAPPQPVVSDGGAQAHASWLTFYLPFEPALAEPGRLSVQHESGLELQVEAERTGVELRLPPGPAALRLVAGAQVWEQPIVVRRAGEFAFDLTK